MDEKKEKEKINVGRVILMAIGFVVMGIGGASTFGSLPDNILEIQANITKKEKQESTEEKPAE